MKVLDLFSGIGGFSLGLERAGMTTVAFCEIEPFCRQVLAKHWPGIPIYDDVRALTGGRLRADGVVPDLICGGFPCQDISIAGKGAGLAGERSGLWRDYARLIGEIRPRFVIVENVAALLSRGLGDVLGDLATLGYDAEWHCIPASAVGAPHRRDRVWIAAHTNGRGWRKQGDVGEAVGGTRAGQSGQYGADVAHTHHTGCREPAEGGARCGIAGARTGMDTAPRGGGVAMAHPGGAGLPGAECAEWPEPILAPADIRRAVTECRWRYAEPGVGGTDDGLSARLDRNARRPVETWEGNTPRTVGRGYPDRRKRLIALGNAVVPQIPELIGRAILAAEERSRG